MSWRLKNKKLIKTASYIYAGYEICSLHFWSFVSFSWSFRGCVFVIKPRCTTRENELETEKKLIKTASYIYASYKFVRYISGRLSLFLDPSEAVSLSSSLDAQGEKMSWRLKNKKLIKTASYIYAGYEICSLHFWSFVSFSWSFRGCVFVIKPRCTTRENELETEKKNDKYR